LTERIIDGQPRRFYRLALLDDGGGELLIPEEKAHKVGIRQLLNRSEIPKLLRHLKKTFKIADTWKQRATDHLELLKSGSAFDLAEIVGSLTELRTRKGLSPAELRTLEKARRLLACEIAEVMGETRREAEQQLDNILEARK
jgi:RNA polymerase-interacting CarD/CdnL/TRCF family regulator